MYIKGLQKIDGVKPVEIYQKVIQKRMNLFRWERRFQNFGKHVVF